MKTFLLGSAFAFAACAAPAAGSGGGGSTTPSSGGDMGSITLRNTSSYDIYSIQLAAFDSSDWGGNLIGEDVLMHGDQQTVAVFDCKKYDLRLVDHEQDECVIQDIDLCFEDKSWDIDDSVLAVCQTGWSAH